MNLTNLKHSLVTLTVGISLASAGGVLAQGPPPWAVPPDREGRQSERNRQAPLPEDDPTPPNLTTLREMLTKQGNNYFVNGKEADFGAQWYINSTTAPRDYDGDGSRETIAEELDGLVSSSVSLRVEEGRDDDYDVYTINGQSYRSTSGGPPPWAGGPNRR